MSAVHRQCHSVIGMPHPTDSDGVRHAFFRDSHPRIAGRYDGFPGFPVNTSICTPISQAASAFVTSPRTGWVIPIPSPASPLPSLPAMEESSSCLVNAAKSDALQSSILFVIPSLPKPMFRFLPDNFYYKASHSDLLSPFAKKQAGSAFCNFHGIPQIIIECRSFSWYY